MKIGYHSGNFKHKADTLFSSLGRSTGYFGTGYYFCVDPDNCNGKNGTEFYKMIFKDGLKWLRGTIRTHENLKTLTRLVLNNKYHECEKSVIKDLKWIAKEVYEFSGDTDFVDYIAEDFKWEKEQGLCDDWKDYKKHNYALRNIIELMLNIDTWHNVGIALDQNEFDEDKVRKQIETAGEDFLDLEHLIEVDDWFREIPVIAIDLSISERDLLDVLTVVQFELDEFYNRQGYFDTSKIPTTTGTGEEIDSISTRILKQLGYDGVWPTKECDNTVYGGVVFEKESFTTEKLNESRKRLIEMTERNFIILANQDRTTVGFGHRCLQRGFKFALHTTFTELGKDKFSDESGKEISQELFIKKVYNAFTRNKSEIIELLAQFFCGIDLFNKVKNKFKKKDLQEMQYEDLDKQVKDKDLTDKINYICSVVNQ